MQNDWPAMSRVLARRKKRKVSIIDDIGRTV